MHRSSTFVMNGVQVCGQSAHDAQPGIDGAGAASTANASTE